MITPILFRNALRITIFKIAFLISLTGYSQLFYQDFESSTVVGDYANVSSPNSGQFNTVSATAASSITANITNGKLVYERSTTGGSGTGHFSRITDIGTPTSLMFSFDLEIVGAGNDELEIDMRIGNGFPTTSNAMDSTETFARLPVNFVTGNGVQFRLLNSATGNVQAAGNNTATFTGPQRISVVCNGSGSNINYYTPAGSTAIVSPGRFDIWIGTTLTHAGIRALNPGVLLREFKMIWGGGGSSVAGKVTFDNFQVNPINELAGTYFVGGGALADIASITNDGGLFAMINDPAYSLTGDCYFKIRGDLTAETGTHALNQKAGMSVHKIYITPDSAVLRTVSGDFNGVLIDLNGADNVKFDGKNPLNPSINNKLLLLRNINTGGSATTLRYVNDATHNKITNTIIEGAGILSTGVINISTGSASGNINDTLQYSTVKNVGTDPNANLPRNLLRSVGSPGFPNSWVLFGNNFYDGFTAANDFNMVNISDNNDKWLIDSNSFYQTAPRIFTVTNKSCHFINILSGGGHIIKNNFFGGTGPQCSGGNTYIHTNQDNSFVRFRAIYVSGVSAIDSTLIHGNVFSKIQSKSTGGSAANGWEAATTAIYVGDGWVSSIDNTIGSYMGSGALSHIFQTSTNAGAGWTAGIYYGNFPIINTGLTKSKGIILGNKIDSLWVYGEGTLAPGTSKNTVAGIHVFSTSPDGSGGDSITIADNIIGSSVNNASLYASKSPTNITPFRMWGISLMGPARFIVKNNVINGISINSNLTNDALIGIVDQATGTAIISQNEIAKLYSNSSSAQNTVTGIFTKGNSIIAANGIYELNSTNTGSANTVVTGIFRDTSLAATFTNIIYNSIYKLNNLSTSASTSPAPSVIGINCVGLTTADSIYNNMISIGGNNDISYRGLRMAVNRGNQSGVVAYNTFYLYGANPGSTHASYGFVNEISTASTDRCQLFNNIIYNARTGGPGNYALGKLSASSTWAFANNSFCINQSLPDYNAYYVTNPAKLASWAGSDRNFAAYKTSSGTDANSWDVSSNFTAPATPFVDPVNCDLHIANLVDAVPFNGRALPALALLQDFDGEFRRSPDIGADEINIKYVFTGATTDWNSPTNWNPNGIPDCGDTVLIPAAKVVDINAGNAFFYQFENNGTLNLNNAAILSGCWLNEDKDHLGRMVNNGVINVTGAGIMDLNTDFINNGTVNTGTLSTLRLNTDSIAGKSCLYNSGFAKPFNQQKDSVDIITSASLDLVNLTVMNNGQTRLVNSQPLKVRGILNLSGGTGTGWLQLNGNTVTLKGTTAYTGSGANKSTLYGDDAATLIIDSISGALGNLHFHTGGSTLNKLILRRTSGSATLGTTQTGGAMDLTVRDSLLIGAGELRIAANTLTLGHTAGGGYVGEMSATGLLVGSGASSLTVLGNAAGTMGDVFFKTAAEEDNQLLNLTMNRTGGAYMPLQTSVKTNNLTLTAGVILPPAGGSVYVNGSPGVVLGGANDSYVAGLLRRNIANGFFRFPVGFDTAGWYMPAVVNFSNSGTHTRLDVRFDTAKVTWGTGWPLTECTDQIFQGPCSGGSWFIAPDDPTSSVNYNITLSDPLNKLNCGSSANITIAKRSNDTSPWTLPGNSTCATGLRNTRTGITSFSQFIFTGTDFSLPIDGLEFSAQKTGEKVVLNWSVKSEWNTDKYEIERSGDGVMFEKIGTQRSRNSITGAAYEYTDASPLLNDNYYRLKQLDVDGAYSYSKIVKVGEFARNDIRVVRSADRIQVQIASVDDAVAGITLVDLLGRIIVSNESAITSNEEKNVDLNVKESGQVYILKVTTSSGMAYTRKMVH